MKYVISVCTMVQRDGQSVEPWAASHMEEEEMKRNKCMVDCVAMLMMMMGVGCGYVSLEDDLMRLLLLEASRFGKGFEPNDSYWL